MNKFLNISFFLLTACGGQNINLRQVIQQDREDTLRCVRELCKDTPSTKDCLELIEICK
jgi:hypothetical protein